MWLILIIVVGIIIYFAFSQNKIPGDSTDIPGETPMDILKKRYARGEISKEEFDRIKSEIEKQPESRVLCNDYQALRAK